MFTLLLWVLVLLLVVYVGWLHRRTKKLERVLNVDTPQFPVTEARARQMIKEALRNDKRGG
jgi:hypothetical protein